MKDVILFKLTYCPHCKLALRLQEELFQAHPEWRDIPLQMIDEAHSGHRSSCITPMRRPSWPASSLNPPVSPACVDRVP